MEQKAIIILMFVLHGKLKSLHSYIFTKAVVVSTKLDASQYKSEADRTSCTNLLRG